MNTIKITHENMGTDYLVRVPKFRISDVIDGASDAIHPAFIVDGKELDAICIGKYQCSVTDGEARSLPYQKAKVNIGFSAASKLCRQKGPGWHLMTNAEWAAVALWSAKNGTLPLGNTSYSEYHVLTGSGPATWSHDHTEDGIYDLCGNVWEWVAGLRIVNGNIQAIPNNDAATADLGQHSAAWQDTGYAYWMQDDKMLLAQQHRAANGYKYCRFKDLPADEGLDTEGAKVLGLYPATAAVDGFVWVDNTQTEKIAYRGGGSESYERAGIFALALNDPRSFACDSLGFRVAFCGEI